MSNERAEEVYKEIRKRLNGHDGMANVHYYLDNLPDFQPGRELTADDVYKAISAARTESLNKDVATELNKIRAPISDVKEMLEHPEIKRRIDGWMDRAEISASQVTSLEKERDELRAQLENKTVCLEDKRKEQKRLDDQLEEARILMQSLKSQPIGVTKEQVCEAIKSLNMGGLKICLLQQGKFAESLAAALSPKWIKTSERMPEKDQDCYCVGTDGVVFASHGPGGDTAGFGDQRGCKVRREHVTHWCERFVPSPPVEEESPLVKHLKTVPLGDAFASVKAKMIEAAKEFEKHEKGSK